ncbi:MAG: transposase [Anaerolineaceae bacterium]|nr:transposase [Anaerolineaceae bacterium]
MLKVLSIKKMAFYPTAFESFNGKVKYEILNGEIFYSLKEAKVVIQMWREDFNMVRSYSSSGFSPPVPQATMNENVARIKKGQVTINYTVAL